MFYWIYDIPTWTLVTVICALFVGVTWVGIILIRPILRALVGRQADMNDLVGYLLGAHGVYLGVLLGLLALSSYENFTNVEGAVVTEATKLSALYRDVSTYPEPNRSKLTTILLAYTEYVVEEAWPVQSKGLIPTKGTEIINEFQRELVKYEPQTRTQEIMHAESFSQLNAFVEALRLRMHAVTTGIPTILWAVVLIGAAVQIFLFWLLNMKLLPHLILSGVIAFYLGTLIALIAAMDNPFRGEESVSSEPFALVLNTVMKTSAATAKADAAAAAEGAEAGGSEAPTAPPATAEPKVTEELKKVLDKPETGVEPPKEEEKKPEPTPADATKAEPKATEELKKVLDKPETGVEPPKEEEKKPEPTPADATKAEPKPTEELPKPESGVEPASAEETEAR